MNEKAVRIMRSVVFRVACVYLMWGSGLAFLLLTGYPIWVDMPIALLIGFGAGWVAQVLEDKAADEIRGLGKK